MIPAVFGGTDNEMIIGGIGMGRRNRRNADREEIMRRKRAHRGMQVPPGAVIDSREKVLVTCTSTGTMRIETMNSLLTVMRSAEIRQRYHVDLHVANAKPYEAVLNSAAKVVLDKGYSWWLHTDNDQAWTDNPFKALGHRKDVICFPTPIFQVGGSKLPGHLLGFNTFRMIQEVEEGYVEGDPRFVPHTKWEHLQRIDLMGTGSFLIRASALKRVKEEVCESEGPFSRVFDDEGLQSEGNDVAFSRRCREAGVEMWADYDCVCRHWHNLEMLHLMTAIRGIAQDVRKSVMESDEPKEPPATKNGPGEGRIITDV